MSDELTAAELQALQATEAGAKEALAYPTLPTGKYRGQGEVATAQRATEKSPWPERVMIRVQARVASTEVIGDRIQQGVIFFEASPELHRMSDGRPDGPYVNWINALNQFGMPVTTDALAAKEAFTKYPLDLNVREVYKATPDGKWQGIAPNERREVMATGAEPRNFVSVSRAQTRK